MTATYQEFLSNVTDGRKPLIGALLKPIIENEPDNKQWMKELAIKLR